ncbi:response regulator [bacterium]|nr:response regulator [Lachnospiraceae bacterium]MBO5146728.1 response regulator [Lachnospiraceae bacterium]MBP3490884.1 response regulator [bacterium]
MRKNILIIEDEEHSRNALVKVALTCAEDCNVLDTDNVAEAYQYALEQDIDLFLIDIILDKNKVHDVSGMIFAERIRQVDRYKYTPIIFITSLVDQGLNALHNIHCYNYIEKPFDIKKVKENIIDALGAPNGADREIAFFTFHKDGILFHIPIEKIMYYETHGRKSYVHLEEEIIEIPYKSCKAIQCELPRKYFLKCNGYTIVNKNYLNMSDKANRYITLVNGEVLEVSRVMKKSFFEDLQ